MAKNNIRRTSKLFIVPVRSWYLAVLSKVEGLLSLLISSLILGFRLLNKITVHLLLTRESAQFTKPRLSYSCCSYEIYQFQSAFSTFYKSFPIES